MKTESPIAVAYLLRGADDGWLDSGRRFFSSYRNHRSGLLHEFHIIYKGFADETDYTLAQSLCADISHVPIVLGDNRFDIGAYAEWAQSVGHEQICVLNTASEILSDDWLYKLHVNLAHGNTGLVGATGSYESLNELNPEFPGFPNIHLRSNAFMIDRKLFCRITEPLEFHNKIDAFRFESGPESLTQQIIAAGKSVAVVGRNGRAYSPRYWPLSETFRQGDQHNLLIGDNQTRMFHELVWEEKREFVVRTWRDTITGWPRLLRN